MELCRVDDMNNASQLEDASWRYDGASAGAVGSTLVAHVTGYDSTGSMKIANY